MKRGETEKPWSPHDVANAMAHAAEMMAPMLEAVTGYRQQCLAAGFNETVAEQMALQFHAMMLGFRA